MGDGACIPGRSSRCKNRHTLYRIEWVRNFCAIVILLNLFLLSITHLSQVGIEFLRNKMADKMLRFISKFVNT